MSGDGFTVEIDGRKVLINQTTQAVTILDGEGTVVFRDRIQVAAGSVQGIFSAVEKAGGLGLTTNPVKRA